MGIEVFAEICDGYKIVRNNTYVGRRKVFLGGDSYMSYWQDILDNLEYSGLKPIFLDDLEVWKESATKGFEAQKKGKKVKKILQDVRDGIILMTGELNEKIEKLRQEIYRSYVEQQSLHEIKREEKILENIAKYRPNVVIVGAGHSESFIQDRELIEKELGITFDEYAREISHSDFIPLDEADFELYSNRVAELVKNPPPDENILAASMSLSRKEFALKLGRILPMQKPDFIGTWDLKIPAMGLFEIYIKNRSDNRLEGLIEDCLGSAQFIGEESDGKLRFVKVYDEMAIKLGGEEKPIIYEGELKDGKYHGTFGTEHSKNRYPFTLEKFDGVIVTEN